MEPARIAGLLAPFIGTSPAPKLHAQSLLSHISTYVDILSRWNARINLTAIRDPEEIITRHFGESLFAANHLFPRETTVCDVSERGGIGSSAVTVADVGSGAGFPGIPIKLWAPEISLTLIESNHKKATFLREACRSLTLTDINIQNARAEALPPASFDVVTLRAVERFESILPTAAALVKPSGRLALLISTLQVASAQSMLPNQDHSSDPIQVPLSRSRVLLLAHRNLDEPTL